MIFFVGTSLNTFNKKYMTADVVIECFMLLDRFVIEFRELIHNAGADRMCD